MPGREVYQITRFSCSWCLVKSDVEHEQEAEAWFIRTAQAPEGWTEQSIRFGDEPYAGHVVLCETCSAALADLRERRRRA